MTKEEAIKAIKIIRNLILKDPSWLKSFTDKVNEAVEMAVNALTAQPETHEERTKTHTCDLISRQAAIDAMCELMHHWFGGDSKDEIREIKRELENLPSAQPEPQRTGRWIPQKGGGLCCSECGGYALDEPDGNFIHVAVPSKFCPNCGARMERE